MVQASPSADVCLSRCAVVTAYGLSFDSSSNPSDLTSATSAALGQDGSGSWDDEAVEVGGGCMGQCAALRGHRPVQRNAGVISTVYRSRTRSRTSVASGTTSNQTQLNQNHRLFRVVAIDAE